MEVYYHNNLRHRLFTYVNKLGHGDMYTYYTCIHVWMIIITYQSYALLLLGCVRVMTCYSIFCSWSQEL